MRISLAETPSGPRLVVEHDGTHHELLVSLDQLLADGPLGPDAIGPAVPDVARLRTPVRPRKIIAIGLNYLDHVREAGAQAPERPLVFAKFPSAVIDDGDPIVVDRAVTQRVDWEVELAVVIGRQARDVQPEEALEHVFGYLVANDVSARDVQFTDGQWIRGKNLDTFCPLGSVVVTADEIRDPQDLALGTTVNDVVKQQSSTAEMVFSVAEIIAFCSQSFTLEPGDVVLTGTPWGCGEFMSPQESLQDGDTVTVWVEGLGTITNTVRELPARTVGG